jgi:hypothetical protein
LAHAGFVLARTTRRVLPQVHVPHLVLVLGLVLALDRPARAADGKPGETKAAESRPADDLSYGDGVAACKMMNQTADKEVSAFRASQPPQPIPDPRPDTVLGAPGWAEAFKGFGNVPLELWLATILPHAGVTLRNEAPAFVLAWPWSFPIGPTMTCSRHQGALFVSGHTPLRLMLEPGMMYGDRLFVFFLRPGARFVYQHSDWVVGLGGGLGSTIDIVSRQEGFRASVSPEVVLRLGKCCDPNYFMLAGRLDVYFAGNQRVQPMVHLGFTYF